MGIGGSSATSLIPPDDLPPELDGAALISIDGPAGRSSVVLEGLTIDGDSRLRGVSAQRVDLIGRDLIFVGGWAPWQQGTDLGPDLYLVDGSLDLSGCSFDSPTSSSSHGGHGWLSGSSVTIEDCTFSNGLASGDGGGAADRGPRTPPCAG